MAVRTNFKKRRDVIHVQTKADIKAGIERFWTWKIVKVMPALVTSFRIQLTKDALADEITYRASVITLNKCVKFKTVK